ncbi:MAG: hypothetical protein ACRDPA_25330, partial [Solirubrobacteraceae bacterium]
MSDDRRPRSRALRPRVALGVAWAALAGCVVWAAIVAPQDHLTGLSIVLALAALAAGLGVARVRQGVEVSAAFLVYILAGAFLGPTSAFVAAVISEVAATRVIPTRRHAFLGNLVAAGFAALLAGTLLRDIAPPEHSASFYLVLAGLALAMLGLTWAIIAPFNIAYDG